MERQQKPKPKQQQAADQENKTRSNPGESEKEEDANTQQGKQKDDHEPDTLERLIGEWMGQEEEPGGKPIRNANIAEE